MTTRHRPSRLTPGWVRLVRSTWGRVLLLLAVLVVVANLGAVAALAWDNFDGYPDALWWATTSLLDPGSLGDDEAWDERVIGLLLTVIGLVVLLGIVIEVVTSAVATSLRRLDEIDVQVKASGHLVVFGWSDLVPAVLAHTPEHRDVAGIAGVSERARRAEIVGAIRSEAPDIAPTVVFDRGGDDPSCFELANVAEAAAVLVHRDDRAGADPETADVDVVERTFRLRRYLVGRDQSGTTAPAVLYDILRARIVDVAAPLLPGYDAVVVDRIITGTIGLGIDHPAWGGALTTMLGSGPGSLVIVPADAWAGGPAVAVAGVEEGLPVGLLRADEMAIPMSSEVMVASTDSLVVLRLTPLDGADATAAPDGSGALEVSEPPHPESRDLTVLLVGWNHRMPVYVEELAARPGDDLAIANLSDVDAEMRRTAVPDRLLDRVAVRFVDGDATSAEDVSSVLQDVDPDVVVVGPTFRDPIRDVGESRRRADAEALLTVLTVAEQPGHEHRVLVADLLLTHPQDIYEASRGIRVLPTAQLRARAMGRVLADPRLGGVLSDLRGGTLAPDTVAFAPRDGAPHAFADVRTAHLRHGITVAGVHRDGRTVLAPDPTLRIQPGDDLLVLRAVSL